MSELLTDPGDAPSPSSDWTAAELLPEETVRAIADEIWASFVGEAEVLVPVEVRRPARAISAWVTIQGPWRGHVVLTCAPAVAEDLTRALLRGRAPEVLGVEDVEDGFGELANVIGGGLKALLPDASSLTLPQVGPVPPVGGTTELLVTSSWRGERLDIELVTTGRV